MSLNWDFRKMAGCVILKQGGSWNLYQGNAYLIMLREYVQDSQEVYELVSFWADAQHMKNCLGLARGTNNIYDDLLEGAVVHLNRAYCSHANQIAQALFKSVKDITIHIYNREVES